MRFSSLIHSRTAALFALVIACGVTQAAQAQSTRTLNWAEKMFSELKHDFGNIAKGADARHNITITNIYQENVRILNVGTTCGCTAAKPDKELLQTGEVATIEVKMNTVKFSRQKNSNVDVTLSFTSKEGVSTSKTIRVPISSYIRPDVVIEPGGVNFGSVDAGTGAEQRVRVSYAGANNWHIQRVETGNSFVEAQAVETSRGGGTVRYDLIVRISPNAPLGTLSDKIVLHTDEAASPTVPVLVEARIEPDIVVTPPVVTLGNELKPGEEKTYTVVLRGKKPFAIEKIECNSAHECFKVRLSQEPKNVHVLPLTFSPPDVTGDFEEEFTITIAGRPEPITLKAQGSIIATTTSTPAN